MSIHSQQVNQYSYNNATEIKQMAKKKTKLLKEINGDKEPTTGEKVAWFILAVTSLVAIILAVI